MDGVLDSSGKAIKYYDLQQFQDKIEDPQLTAGKSQT